MLIVLVCASTYIAPIPEFRFVCHQHIKV